MIERILKLERVVRKLYCKIKEGGPGGGLQSVLDTGSEATLIPSIDIQAGEFEIKADGMNSPNSISINKGGYTVDISSRSGGVNVTSSGGDIVLENSNSGINLYAKGFIDIKSPESTIGLEAKYVYIDSKGALNFNSVQNINFQSQQGFNITSMTGISIFSETSSAVVVGNSTGFISIDSNLNLYLPPESIGITSETDYTSNYPTDGTEDAIFPQIKYIKDNFCEEAPQDGNFYARQNGVWVNITSRLNP